MLLSGDSLLHQGHTWDQRNEKGYSISAEVKITQKQLCQIKQNLSQKSEGSNETK